MTMINVYESYDNKQRFWEDFFVLAILKEEFLIISGDLNFTLNTAKIWGSIVRMDKLGDFLINKIEESELIELEPSNISPTLMNNRVGEARV